MTSEQWLKIWGHPQEEYFSYAVIGYYEDGRKYDYRYGNRWVGDIQETINDAAKYGWKASFEEETKVFTFEKHFANGMYRIATYTPYNKNALDITVHLDN